MKINIYDILTWIFFIISLFIVGLYLFGKSPTIEQALLILIIGFFFQIQAHLASTRSELLMLRRSFSALARDFKNHIKQHN